MSIFTHYVAVLAYKLKYCNFSAFDYPDKELELRFFKKCDYTEPILRIYLF